MNNMSYSKKVLEHFKNPHNQGVIENPTVVGEAGNLACGDILKLYLKINDKGIIEDVKFETLGCAAAIATSSMVTDMVKGKTIEEASKVTKDNIADALEGLPTRKMHCSVLAIAALHDALKEYQERQEKR